MINSLQLKVIFWLAVAVWAGLLFVDGQALNVSLLKPSSIVLGCVIAIVTVFEKWAWRLKWLHPWFVRTPDLIGTYKGEIRSHWVDPATGARVPSIPAYLVIRQSLSNIYVRLYTAESDSCSVHGSFVEAPDGKNDLLYSYRNEPRLDVRHRSQIHYGGTKLSIDEKIECLDGSYWTDRNTVGELKFNRVGQKPCHSFAECESLSTVTTNSGAQANP